MPARYLDYAAGPLVWIDCEMTGLNHKTDKILEIAVLITNGNLELVDQGLQFIIKTDQKYLSGMDEWCTNQHGKSGLTQACLSSEFSHEHVYRAVLAYIKQWIPRQRVGMLAGSSIHADRAFLAEAMPDIVDWLHYRMVDVSSVKELVRRWYPETKLSIPKYESDHRALSDIKASINELKWYRNNVFKSPPLDLPPPPEAGDKQE